MGQVLLPALIRARFIVTAISRPGASFNYPDVISKTASYDNLQSLIAALQDQDAIIEAFNPAAAASQALIVTAALASKVSHIITPDFSSDTFNEHVNELQIFQPKREAQQVLENSGISWTAIIVGPWYDWAIENGQFWIDRKSQTITRFGSGNQKISMSRLEQNAQAAVAVLQAPDRYRNRPIYVASHTVSTNDLIAIVEASSKTAWKVVDVPLEELAAKGKEQWELDTKAGVKDRLQSSAYRMLGTAALFNEVNRYSADFGDKMEKGWDEGLEALQDNVKKLFA